MEQLLTFSEHISGPALFVLCVIVLVPTAVERVVKAFGGHRAHQPEMRLLDALDRIAETLAAQSETSQRTGEMLAGFTAGVEKDHAAILVQLRQGRGDAA